MTIPDFQMILLPLLKLTADQNEHSNRKAIEVLADHFNLSEVEREELLPSGRQARFDNRVAWARTHLGKARLLESPRRGYFSITNRGIKVFGEKPQALSIRFLRRYPEYAEFQPARSTSKPAKASHEIQNGFEAETPIEAIETAYQTVRSSLASELLEKTMECSPGFFERLVVDVLVNIGYGGTRKLDRLLARAAMGASTASLMRIGWDWKLFTFKRSVGRILSADQRFKSLSGLYKDKTLVRVFL